VALPSWPHELHRNVYEAFPADRDPSGKKKALKSLLDPQEMLQTHFDAEIANYQQQTQSTQISC
jgi:hypothetical protein